MDSCCTLGGSLGEVAIVLHKLTESGCVSGGDNFDELRRSRADPPGTPGPLRRGLCELTVVLLEFVGASRQCRELRLHSIERAFEFLNPLRPLSSALGENATSFAVRAAKNFKASSSSCL
jgi:hypothetical protein